MLSSAQGSPVQHGRRWRRIYDWLAYAAIAVLIIGVVIAWALYQARTGGSTKLPLKWLGWIGMTAVIFTTAARAGRRTRPGRRFWDLLAIFFLIHTGVWLFILTKVSEVPLLLYALLGGPEYILLIYSLDFFFQADE